MKDTEAGQNWFGDNRHEWHAMNAVDEIFMHHGDRCLDQTRASLVEAFAEEARVRDVLAEQLVDSQLRCRNWFWLWVSTSVLLGCAAAALWMGITI